MCDFRAILRALSGQFCRAIGEEGGLKTNTEAMFATEVHHCLSKHR